MNLLNDVKARFEGEKASEDGKMHLLADIRKACLMMEEISNKYEWDEIEQQLLSEFANLESTNNDLGNEYDIEVASLKQQVAQDIRQKNVTVAKNTLENIGQLFVHVTLIYQLVGVIRGYHANFVTTNWKDPVRARGLLSQGMEIINTGAPSVQKLHPIVMSIFDCLADSEEREKLTF